MENVTMDLPLETEQVNQAEIAETIPDSATEEGIASTPEQKQEESKETDETKAPVEKPIGKQPYTAEEMRSLDPSQIDTSRIPPEHQAFYKAMQAAYTRKFQEAAEARKQFEEPKTIQEAFDRDPYGVLEKVGQEISLKRISVADKEAEDPFSPDVIKFKRELALLENMRDDFNNQMIGKVKQMTSADRMRAEIDAATREAIPDYNSEKEQKLTQLAMETFGLGIDDINRIVGNLGTKIVGVRKYLNQLYTEVNAGKSADTKLVKKAPPPLERAGTGAGVEGEKDPSKMTFAEYKKWRSQKKE